MLRPILKHIRSAARLRAIDPTVSQDADELIQLWGSVAYDKAADLSWREDSGLVMSSQPGHWWRVRREIGRRLGHQENEPVLEFAA